MNDIIVSMKKIELCIFDMDGLMLDTERYLWIINERKALAEFGYEIDDDFLKRQMGGSWEVYRKNLMNKFGPDFPYEKYFERILQLNKYTIENTKLPKMKGLMELLEFLKKNHIRMSVATSTSKVQAHACLKNAEIYDYFENIICGDEVSNAKPDPEIYIKSYEALGVSYENVLIFEDAHNGALSALASKARLILVPDLAYLSDDDKQKAFAVINNLEEAIDIIKKENQI